MSATPTLSIAELLADVPGLDESAFREQYGDAFLLHEASDSGLQAPKSHLGTLLSAELDPTDKPTGWLKDYRVYPVRRSGRSAVSDSVTVGRAPNNDVVIFDASISKFHAVFDEVEGAGLTVRDAGSKNGTQVNGARVPDLDDAEGMAVRPGDRVRFGHVELTFLGAEELVMLLRHAATVTDATT